MGAAAREWYDTEREREQRILSRTYVDVAMRGCL
jgi:hypothetical protein